MSSSKEYKELKSAILSKKTTEEVLDVLRHYNCGALDYKTQLGWIFACAIKLAQTPAEAMLVFENEWNHGKPEEEAAFDKVLNLCKYKEDVEKIMFNISSWAAGSLENEKWYLKIFKRGHELPHKSVARV